MRLNTNIKNSQQDLRSIVTFNNSSRNNSSQITVQLLLFTNKIREDDMKNSNTKAADDSNKVVGPEKVIEEASNDNNAKLEAEHESKKNRLLEGYVIDNFAGLMQAYTDNLVKELNQQLPSLIEEAHLDPLKKVLSEHKDLANFDLGFITTGVSTDYTLTDLTGLSSLTIANIDNTHLTGGIKTFNIKAEMPLFLTNDLHADISGDMRSRVGFFGQSVTISGSAKVKNITLDSTISLQGHISLLSKTIHFKSLEIDNLSLNYDEIRIRVNGLGVFNRFVSPFSMVLSRILKSYLTKAADKEIIAVVNAKLATRFPISFDLKKLD